MNISRMMIDACDRNKVSISSENIFYSIGNIPSFINCITDDNCTPSYFPSI